MDEDAFLREVVGPRRRDEPRLAPAFERTEVHMVPTPHGRVAAWRLGEGPAVLLAHGWEDDHSLWAPLIDALAARGRAVVACDFPGHGRSEGEVGYRSEWTDACLAVASALGPVDAIVTHSAGCGPSVMAVCEGLAVDRLVLVAPPLRAGDRWRRVAGRLGVPVEVADRARATYEARLPPHRVEFDVAAALRELRAALLFVHSVDDERMPSDATEELAATCPGSQVLLPNGLTHRRTARDPAVVDRIVDFLSG